MTTREEVRELKIHKAIEKERTEIENQINSFLERHGLDCLFVRENGKYIMPLIIPAKLINDWVETEKGNSD